MKRSNTAKTATGAPKPAAPSPASRIASILVPDTFKPFSDLIFDDLGIEPLFEQLTGDAEKRSLRLFGRLLELHPSSKTLIGEIEELQIERVHEGVDAAFLVGLEVGKRLAGGAR